MVHRSLPIFSCQYHPESAPGPHDSHVWFRAFLGGRRQTPRQEGPTGRRGGWPDAEAHRHQEDHGPLAPARSSSGRRASSTIPARRAAARCRSASRSCSNSPRDDHDGPGFADRDVCSRRAQSKERPDALLPTLGARPRSTCGFSLPAACRGVRRAADRRVALGDRAEGPRPVQRRRWSARAGCCRRAVTRPASPTCIALGETLGYPLVARRSRWAARAPAS